MPLGNYEIVVRLAWWYKPAAQTALWLTIAVLKVCPFWHTQIIRAAEGVQHRLFYRAVFCRGC